MSYKILARVSASLAAASALAVLTVGGAHAQTVTGWVGPAGSAYLDTSSIINTPTLKAQSRIYSTFGAEAAPGAVGVRARLFKSGVLCEAIDYRYNSDPTTDFTAGTTKTCGTGSYNSHGFVAVWNATNFNYDEYLTFPSNPLNWTAPATARAAAQSNEPVQTGTNSQGKKFGSADTTAKGAVPDLVAAYATNGRLGYVKKTDLDTAAPKSPAEAAARGSAPRSVAVYATDGTTQLGTFQIG